MKALLFLLALSGLVLAQYDNADSTMYQCEKSCCGNSLGSWNDTYHACVIEENTPRYNDFYSCDNQCKEKAAADINSINGSSSFCCAPSFILLLMIGGTIGNGIATRPKDKKPKILRSTPDRTDKAG